MKSGKTIPLGTCEFDPGANVLRDAKGQVVTLRSQTLKVLARLCEEPGEIVSKSDLFESVWSETFVTDSSLVQCIREIRHALEDGDFEVIRTLPRQGYMVVPSTGPDSTPDTPMRYPVLAVLGFAGDRQEPQAGLAVDLITVLAKCAYLSVVSQRTAAALSKRNLSIREVAAETGADYVLTGQTRFKDGTQQVIVELVDAGSDKVLWSETYAMAPQRTGDTAEDIVDKISATVGYLTTYARPTTGRPNTGEAARLHLEARIEMDKQTSASIDRAEELNRLAVKADPASHYGYVGLAFTYHLRHEYGLWPAGPEDALRIADEFAEKAVAIAPNHPSVLFARSAVYLSQGKLEGSIACLDRAVQLNPSDSAMRVALAEVHAFAGNTSAALDLLDFMSRDDVVYPDWQNRLRAFILWAAGQFAEALECARKDPVTPTELLLQKCVILVANGCLDEAREAMEKFKQAKPDHTLAFEQASFARKFRDESKVQAWVDALCIAGLPE